jgi:hypothetical protein
LAVRRTNDAAEAAARKLRRHFKFSLDDLAANRRGVLSRKQMARIAGYDRGGRMLGGVVGAALLLFSALFTPMALSAWKTVFGNVALREHLLWAWLLINAVVAVFGLLMAALAPAGIFLIVSQFLNRKSYRVQHRRGRARLKMGRGNSQFGHVYYDLYIDDQEFDGDSSLIEIIAPGAEYSVYFLEGVEEIVAIELISDGADTGNAMNGHLCGSSPC